MEHKGLVYKFGNDINTDFIISGRYKFSITDMKELSKHMFEDIRPDFYKEITPKKSIIVAGENFGMGSSREQAPRVIKEAGVVCVIAKSFARIFYRNAFNIGLPLLEVDTSNIEEKDELIIEYNKGIIKNITKNKDYNFIPWSDFQLKLIKLDGIVNYLSKYGAF